MWAPQSSCSGEEDHLVPGNDDHLVSRYHNNTMINFSPGVRVTTSQETSQDREELWVSPPNTTVSTLTIQQTQLHHAGNYTCAPPHATSDTVRLYVAQSKKSNSNVNTKSTDSRTV